METKGVNSSMPTGSIVELLKWLENQVDEGRREKANDPNLPEAERMRYRTADELAQGPPMKMRPE